MEQTELQRAIEAILFAAGERIETARLSMALEVDEDEIVAAANALAGQHFIILVVFSSNLQMRTYRFFFLKKYSYPFNSL